MAKEEIKKQLEDVSSQLVQAKSSIATCNQLAAGGKVSVVSGEEVKEGEQPLSLNINSEELITEAMKPIIRALTYRVDRLLAIKEQLLLNLEIEIEGVDEARKEEMPLPEKK